MSKCSLCGHTSEDIFELRACKHIFCHKCLCKHIKSHVDCKIKCPLDKCIKKISDQIIRKCLSNSEIESYEKISLSKSTKHARRCLTNTCPTIMFIEDDDSIFQCQFCEQPNCLKCKRRHYPNQCGLLIQNEDDIEAAAKVAMSQHRRKVLEEQMKNDDYTPNPESFECEICNSFILPRAGLIMRNCFHCCCKSCFEDNLKTVNFISHFKCPKCSVELSNHEIMKAIGVEKMIGMHCNEAAPKMFCCKFPECNGMWDNRDIRQGTFNCPVCEHTNCLGCEDVHEFMSCEEFRKTKRYIDAQKAKEKLKATKGIECKCGRLLIQKGGCGALHCDSCGKQICVFTKKIAGNNGPDKLKATKGIECKCGRLLIQKGGCGALHCDSCGKQICVFTKKIAGNNGPDTCGCIPTSPCHPDCKYGCFPE